jgi:hypothetical protein
LARRVGSGLEPKVDVGLPETKVTTDAVRAWARAFDSPSPDAADGYAEVFAELLHPHETARISICRNILKICHVGMIPTWLDGMPIIRYNMRNWQI